jgi:4-amino-4-deoxy-L-arabinose transferase-like glycosyltransferase
LGYISDVLRLIREHRLFFLGTLATGLGLRLLFFFWFPMMTDDSRVYVDLATNWLQHGVYGQTQAVSSLNSQSTPETNATPETKPETKIVPIDSRLPGYPAFLAAILWLFGIGNIKAVLLTQIVVDLATCVIIADLARRMVSDRAARVAFLLAALCPFLANYTAAVLTETLEVFFTALALDCAAGALDHMRGVGQIDRVGTMLWAGTGAAICGCILLRPDGGVLLASVLLYLLFLAMAAAKGTLAFGRGSLFIAATVVAVIVLAVMAPWTMRNLRTLHHFQPLAPRYANESDELVPRGFNRWVKTWMIDYASVEEIYWNVPGDKIDATKLPSRAFYDAAQKEATLAVIEDYNDPQDLTPELDARFGEIAAAHIRAHPVRYYVVLPVLRMADMWLRPRTEILPPDVRWWEFNDDWKRSAGAVGFGLLNLAFLGAALWALFWRRAAMQWMGLLVFFLLLRSALLLTLENPEPRYTLEGYPAVIVLAAALTKNGAADPSVCSQ